MRNLLLAIVIILTFVEVQGQCSGLAINSNKNEGCVPTLAEFVLTGAPSGSSYVWNVGKGDFSGGDTIYSYFQHSGQYSVSTKVIFPNGTSCLVDSLDILKVHDKPILSLSLSAIKLCDGPDNVHFKDLTPNSLSRSWVIDGTNYSNTPDSITHKFVSEGWKSLSLIVTDSNGCTGVKQFQDTIIIYKKLEFDFKADVSAGCVPQEVNLEIIKETTEPGFRNNYSWEIGLTSDSIVNVSKKQPDALIYNTAGSFNASLFVSVSNGCKYSVRKDNFINVGDTFALQLAKQKDTVCKYEQIQIQQNNPISRDSLIWAVSGADFILDSSDNEAIWLKGLEPGFLDFTLTYNFNGCLSVLNVEDYIYIHDVEAQFSSPNHYHCKVPHTVDLINRTDTSSAFGFSYLWTIIGNGGPTDSSSSKNPRFTFYDMSTSFDVQLIAQDAYGCKDTQLRKEFIYQDTMKLLFDVAPKVGCPNQTIQLLNETRPTTFKSGDVFKWMFYDLDDTTVLDSSELRAPTTSYDSLGFYDIAVIGSNSEGCRDTLLLEDVVEIVMPELDYSISDEQICIGDTFCLKGQSSPERAQFNYFWMLKDIDSNKIHLADGNDVQIIPENIGSHMLYYRHNIANGCISEDSTLVRVNGVIAEIALDTSYGCSPLVVRPRVNILRDLSKERSATDYTYNWIINSETGWSIAESNTGTPKIQFTQEGDYEIKLEITNAFGCSFMTDAKIIKVGVRAGFSFDDNTICLGDSLFLVDQSYNGVTQTKWIVSDSQTVSLVAKSENRKSFYINQPGSYNLKQIVSNKGICSDTIVKPFRIIEVIAEFNATDSFLRCAPVYAEFFSRSKAADTLIWNFGIGQEFKTVSPSAGTIYEKNSGWTDGFDIQLVAMNREGCYDTLLKEDYVVVAGPVPQFEMENFIGCEPLEVRFKNQSKDAFASYINYNDGSRLDSTIKDGYFSPHIYQVQMPDALTEKVLPSLIVYDSLGCIASFEPDQSIEIFRKPIASFTYPKNQLWCEKDLIVGIDSSIYTDEREWFLDDKLTSQGKRDSLENLEFGDYQHKLITTNSKNCSDTFTRTISLFSKPKITLSREDSLCYDRTHLYTAEILTDDIVQQFLWTFNSDGITEKVDSNSIQVIHSFQNKGNKQVRFWATQSNGCSDTVYLTFELTGSERIDTPLINYVSFIDEQQVEVSYKASDYDRFLNYVLSYNQEELKLYNQDQKLYSVDLGYKPTDPVYFELNVEDYCNLKGQPGRPHAAIILSISSKEAYQNRLDWTPYQGWDTVDRYDILKENSDGTLEQLASVPGSKLFYIDSNLCDQSYTYRVEAINTQLGLSSKSYKVSNNPIYLHNSVQSSIKNVTVTDNDEINVSWHSSTFSEFTKYKLYKYEESDDNVIDEFELEDTIFLDANVNVNTHSYIYRVEEIDRCGYATPKGRQGKSILLTGKYTEASNLDWTAYLKWQNGVRTYNVEVNTAGEFKKIFSSGGENLTYVDDAIYDNEEGAYCYRVYADNDRGDTSYSNKICLFGPPKNYIPNAFSPNGDGLNDVFEPISKFLKSNELSQLKDFQIDIYSRWGELIYRSNDISGSWDGTYQGDFCPQGVYLYMIKVKGMDNSLLYENGTITLLR